MQRHTPCPCGRTGTVLHVGNPKSLSWVNMTCFQRRSLKWRPAFLDPAFGVLERPGGKPLSRAYEVCPSHHEGGWLGKTRGQTRGRTPAQLWDWSASLLEQRSGLGLAPWGCLSSPLRRLSACEQPRRGAGRSPRCSMASVGPPGASAIDGAPRSGTSASIDRQAVRAQRRRGDRQAARAGDPHTDRRALADLGPVHRLTRTP